MLPILWMNKFLNVGKAHNLSLLPFPYLENDATIVPTYGIDLKFSLTCIFSLVYQ